MSKRKKWLIGLGVCLGLVLLLGLICYLFARPWYYRLFYPWDRYVGTVTVELDGQPAAFTVEGTSLLQPVRASRQGIGRARVSMHAGSYGTYRFRLRVQGLEQPIEFSSHKWNWKVIRYDAKLSIDREQGTVTLSGTVRWTNDRGQFVERPLNETASLTDETVSLLIIW